MIVRQEIFERVVAQLRRIKTTNTYTLYGGTLPYLTNLGNTVFPWRAAPFQPGESGIIVRDLDEPVMESAPRSERVIRQLHIQVEVVLAADDPVTRLWQAYADIEAAIGEGRDSVWADITSNTRPRLSRSLVEQESAKIAGGIVECFIDYPTLAFRSVA
jgi:hypothetical protein